MHARIISACVLVTDRVIRHISIYVYHSGISYGQNLIWMDHQHTSDSTDHFQGSDSHSVMIYIELNNNIILYGSFIDKI